MITLTSGKFNWNNKDNTGTSCVSDLQVSNWPDRFYVKSKRTGARRLFLFQDVIKVGSGEDEELGGMIYVCPGGGLSITIFND